VIYAATTESNNFEGAIYRCAQESSCIIHVPQVLYHNRETGTNACSDLTPQAASVKTHLERCGLAEVSIQKAQNGMYHATWAFQKMPVSIIILNWNGLDDTVHCLESLRKITYPNYDIIFLYVSLFHHPAQFGADGLSDIHNFLQSLR
jgi:hypothetical protein